MTEQKELNVRGISILLAAVLLSVFLSVTNGYLRPVLRALALSGVEEAAVAAVQDAITAKIAGEGLSYGELVTLHTDVSGRITALSCDLERMNLFRAGLLSVIQETLDELGEQDFSIPCGNLTNLSILSGRGPTITVRVQTVGTAAAEFEHNFSEAGINQTLHQIILQVNVNMIILLPGQRLELPLSTRMAIAETVIVGEVPETYVHTEQ